MSGVIFIRTVLYEVSEITESLCRLLIQIKLILFSVAVYGGMFAVAKAG
tara:strand:- start:332 stop:478 length:147 start_codon:yes stop_codon:yes gene_type:complete